MSRIVKQAMLLAAWGHCSIKQYRKYTGDPYIHHPASVADLVESVPHTEEQVAAAWLHDTLEDTEVTQGQIICACGREVLEMVIELTDISRPEDGNRAKRKEIDRIHLSHARPQTKTVKLADLIDNTRSILQNDRDFARTYLAEKRLLLPVLIEGDGTLHHIASSIAFAKYEWE